MVFESGCQNLVARPNLKPFSLTFCTSLNSGTFPDEWEKTIIVQTHKKDNDQTVNNCHSVSLLPSATHKSSFLTMFLISWNRIICSIIINQDLD